MLLAGSDGRLRTTFPAAAGAAGAHPGAVSDERGHPAAEGRGRDRTLGRAAAPATSYDRCRPVTQVTEPIAVTRQTPILIQGRGVGVGWWSQGGYRGARL